MRTKGSSSEFSRANRRTWTQYIKEDLRLRIRHSLELPSKLTLSNLAKWYGVSLMPVRAAVRDLLKEGIFVKHRNGRLGINPSFQNLSVPDVRDAPSGPPPDLYQEVANYLVELSLAGRPLLVREEETAKKFGVSQSLIRQVFNRLAGAGLLRHIPRRGWELRPFSQKTFRDFLQVREALELLALKLAWHRLDRDKLLEIRGRNRLATNADERPEVDNSIHSYIIHTAGNQAIIQFFEQQGRYFEVLYVWDALDRERCNEAVLQHHAIIDAILKGDKRAAKKALSHHILTNYSPILVTPTGASESSNAAPPKFNH